MSVTQFVQESWEFIFHLLLYKEHRLSKSNTSFLLHVLDLSILSLPYSEQPRATQMFCAHTWTKWSEAQRILWCLRKNSVKDLTTCCENSNASSSKIVRKQLSLLLRIEFTSCSHPQPKLPLVIFNQNKYSKHRVCISEVLSTNWFFDC